MPNLVKGAGFAKIGGNEPLRDDGEIFKRSYEAERSLRKSVKDSLTNPDMVRKSINPAFTAQFGLFLTEGANPGYGALVAELNNLLSSELGKNITLTSPLSSGFVPFDLVAPSRLIYPVYSPIRNKVPRVTGQGTSHRAKLVTAVSGSQTGVATQRISISEIPNGQSINGNWPLNLPAAGAQNAQDMNIPYKFFGLSESLSWLAQFAGQGFEDISALANLVLLQEFMMGEEYTLLSGTSAALAAPGTPTVAKRTATSSETPLSGLSSNDLFVLVTALNYFGETTVTGTAAVVASAEGDVVDVTIVPVNGAYNYNIYIAQAASSQPANSDFYLMAAGVGAHVYTLQGAVPTSGTNPPSADTGTSSSNDYEGWLSIIDGHAGGFGGGASVYPTGFMGSYINKSIGATLSHDVLFTALQEMWNGKVGQNGNTSTTGGFRADPAELVVEGSDSARLSDEVISAGGATNYRLFLTQDEVGSITTGGAVSEIQNPITRSIVRIVVHPWLFQGTAFLNSYTLPMSWSNVTNVWENVMVQDYLSINWPVIDASFRYSIYMFGALVNYAPQYNGVLQGLQQSVAGTTGTNS
jgi:hypothetical protein